MVHHIWEPILMLLLLVGSASSVLWDVMRKSVFTRLPVYERQPANIIGFVNIYDCLNRCEQFTDLHELIKPIRRLAETTVVTEAINIMQAENHKIVLVTRTNTTGREKPAGIVTLPPAGIEITNAVAQRTIAALLEKSPPAAALLGAEPEFLEASLFRAVANPPGKGTPMKMAFCCTLSLSFGI